MSVRNIITILLLVLFPMTALAAAKKSENLKDWETLYDAKSQTCLIKTEAKRVRGEHDLSEEENYFYIKKIGENQYSMAFAPSEQLVEGSNVTLEVDARYYGLEMFSPSKVYTFSSVQDVDMINIFLLADWKYFIIRMNVDPTYKNVLYFSLNGFIPAMKSLAKCQHYKKA